MAEISFLRKTAGLSLRDRVSSAIQEELRSRAPTLPHQKETVQVVWASDRDEAPPSSLGLRLHLSAGLGMA